MRLFRKGTHDFVICIEYGKFTLRTIFENAGFEIDVVFHRVMPIEMIFGDVQNNGNMRTERGKRLKLE